MIINIWNWYKILIYKNFKVILSISFFRRNIARQFNVISNGIDKSHAIFFYEKGIQKSYDIIMNYHGVEKAKYYFFQIRILTPILHVLFLSMIRTMSVKG